MFFVCLFVCFDEPQKDGSHFSELQTIYLNSPHSKTFKEMLQKDNIKLLSQHYKYKKVSLHHYY